MPCSVKRANLRLIQFVAQLIFIIAVVLAERQRESKSHQGRTRRTECRRETKRQDTHRVCNPRNKVKEKQTNKNKKVNEISECMNTL